MRMHFTETTHFNVVLRVSILLLLGVEYVEAWAGNVWTTPIKYCFEPDGRALNEELFAKATANITFQVPCITWKKIQKGNASITTNPCEEANAIFVKSKTDGCYSESIGMKGTGQTIGLGPGCQFLGVVLHQLGKALGMTSEATRSDRDTHIDVHAENIIEGKESVFAVNAKADVVAPYDPLSLMHPGSWDWSSDGNPTITTKYPALQLFIGQRNGFSENDVNQLGRMYDCATTVKSVAGDAALSAKMVNGDQIPVYARIADNKECTDSKSNVFMTTANTLDVPVSCVHMAKMVLGEQYGLCGVNEVRTACPLSCGLCSKKLSAWYDPSCEGTGADGTKKCFAASIGVPYVLWCAIAWFLWA